MPPEPRADRQTNLSTQERGANDYPQAHRFSRVAQPALTVDEWDILSLDGYELGREHNSHALAMWMADGNVKRGASAGETDEFGLIAIGEPIPVRDVHAAILNLLGLNDDELRYLHAGRLRQLTDIGGNVVGELIDS
ncbi:MAG: DUF1501 domain-containing protein [Planctomycetaceae bacterium]